jgi:hypothetical protein
MRSELRVIIYLVLFCLGCCQIVSAQFSNTPKPDFRKLAGQRLGKELSQVCPVDTSTMARRIFLEYGAIYIADSEVTLPQKCIFPGEQELRGFQISAGPKTSMIDGVAITLQAPAMEAFLQAREKAAKLGLRISPRGGSMAGGRSYEESRILWNSRVFPGLNYWVRKGKLAKGEAAAARLMSTNEQVEQILNWEADRKLFFSKDLSKSILYSVAAPGASQHNFLLAIDIQQFADRRIRAIMAEFGWFQTVKSDIPHFTYLGRKESDLPSWGLKQVFFGGQNFWIPDLE